MGWIPPAPLPPSRRPGMWRAMCEGCGAPLQVHQGQCSYCLRATGAEVPMVEVTALGDVRRRFVPAIDRGQPSDAFKNELLDRYFNT
jgi:hypothetical protein